MIFTSPRAALAAVLVLGTPLIASPAIADTDVKEQAAAPAPEAPVPAPVPAPQTDENAAANTAAQNAAAPAADEQPEAATQVEEEAVTCRYIRLDMSSRRKTRVCRTAEGWRQLNQQR